MTVKYESGIVLRYPYVWRWQTERGETEGRKQRPVCLAISVHSPRDGFTHLAMLAISSQPPVDPANAIEIPEIERRRGGLSEHDAAWITVSEYNYDILEKSFYLDANLPPLGRFSKSFMRKIAMACKPLFAQPAARIDRR